MFLFKIFRFLLVGIWFAIVCLACLPIFLFRWKDSSNNRIFCRLLARPVCAILGVRVEIVGEEKLAAHQPCVYVANHQSNFDVVLFSFVYPARTVAIGKRSLISIPVFGWLMWLGGNLMVDRSNHKNTMDAMRVADDALTKARTSIFFFPEGTRSKGKGLGKFKKGAFVCAARNSAPLVPIVASELGGRLDYGAWRAGTVRLKVLDPIPTSPTDLENLEPLMERVRDCIAGALVAI